MLETYEAAEVVNLENLKADGLTEVRFSDEVSKKIVELEAGPVWGDVSPESWTAWNWTFPLGFLGWEMSEIA